jgi:hypothetical protein
MSDRQNSEFVSHEGRCGAKTRRGTVCRQWPVPGRTRCHYHGGRSTGPRTVAGRERIRRANWRHGLYSKEHQRFMQRIHEIRKANVKILERLKHIASVNPRPHATANHIELEHRWALMG